MKKLNLAIIFVVFLLSSVMLANSAYATSGWVTSLMPKVSHSMLNQIGKTKVCGDHICTSFEFDNVKKILNNAPKTNSPYLFQKQLAK